MSPHPPTIPESCDGDRGDVGVSLEQCFFNVVCDARELVSVAFNLQSPKAVAGEFVCASTYVFEMPVRTEITRKGGMRTSKNFIQLGTQIRRLAFANAIEREEITESWPIEPLSCEVRQRPDWHKVAPALMGSSDLRTIARR